MARNVRMGGLGGFDGLPFELILHIMGFLPTKDAVRTSILSTKWRNRFGLLSSFDLYDCLQNLSPANIDKFSLFVDRLLSYTRTDIEKFSLYAWKTDHLDDWIAKLLSRSLKELVLGSERPYTLPDILFTSQTLLSLKLDIGGGDIRFQTNITLPSLKNLHVTNFVFTDGSFFNLISTCRVLQELGIFDCEFPDTIVLTFQSVSLERFILDSTDLVFEIADQLDHAIEISAPSLSYFKYMDRLASRGYNITINDTRHLNLGINLPEMIFPEGVVFHNLVILEYECCEDDRDGSWLLKLLHGMPQLKKLVLVKVREMSLLWTEEVSPCLVNSVQEIEFFLYRRRTEKQLDMAEYFLRHGSMLQTLTVHIGVKQGSRSRVIERLLGFPRSSGSCLVKPL
ncbi:hypothetical protein V6N11_021068 [Hibiscus sabdariffa]|uniref:FBD domain-containing protein n=2 Tax=Hibiscus sabdariffa TaxID=183260 RepID=A0ABR2D8V6_9ROSI